VVSHEAVAANQGTLVLADISGYTAFLQSVGAAHGEEMARTGVIPDAYPLMATLLDGIVEHLAPPFTLSKTEGDAVFMFAPPGELDLRGQALLDCMTACYAHFADHIAAMNAAVTCSCDACTLGINLDLKFIVHAGGYVLHPIAGRQELLGPDVNAVHRLLKNHAHEVVGRRPYVLLTAAAASLLEVPVERAQCITETYEYLEPIQSYVFTIPTR
jgi:hypothetical protein